ncbi:MAG: three-Cys-motif partner protein TcmP [Pyrinomonadaceae bacterium]|nr:three-Cys-motif partner protein TcmP [Pyrinomonadaceae bacterium]
MKKGRQASVQFDEIGYWSEVKLDIVKEYATAYSTILSAQKNLYHVYVDAFAGAGVHISKISRQPVAGSPLNALVITPPFREFHLVDLDSEKIDVLKQIVGQRTNVYLYTGDCNKVLLKDIFPKIKYEGYRRGLCLLDPYGLHLNWEVIATAGQMKSIDMFLNFPIMDMNRNALWKNPDKVSELGVKRMNAFWGDDSWRNIAYTAERNLFGLQEKEDNEVIVNGFQKRLKEVAGFKHVARPIPMRNKTGAEVYYLFFASQKAVASDIVKDIFDKYRTRGAR